jgi:hypothetical protein
LKQINNKVKNHRTIHFVANNHKKETSKERKQAKKGNKQRKETSKERNQT